MEANVCGVNHLDSDVLLPPRKRLLACLKRQNSDINGDSNSNPISPSTHNSLDQLDARITYLLKPHLRNRNPSQEEIVTASRTAAESAVKVAMTARAAAQAKAAVAAKAMAAAKKALELVAKVEDDQMISSSLEQHLWKGKTKKQINVQMLYDNSNNNNNPGLENGKTNDEELARKLHQAINSSPRISNFSDVKNHKHKKLKTSGNGSKLENGSKIENGSKAKSGDDDVTTQRKGRMKQKKLPLSICHYTDQPGPKEDVIRSPLSVRPGETGPLWKCQAFKAPVCVKQTKVMQL